MADGALDGLGRMCRTRRKRDGSGRAVEEGRLQVNRLGGQWERNGQHGGMWECDR